ncbi:MAG: hypothetical protein JWN65_2712 [Solirubrobacterales bacterium]|nr:hypothetical protein [Solirubrobacterales bacterium]
MKYSALSLSTMGFEVLPLFGPGAGGGCSCRRSNCGSPAKHPRTAHGIKDASSNLATVGRWWETWPKANIGIRTGSGLVVVDIDGPDGEEAIQQYKLPATVEARTGRGRHLFYQGDMDSKVGLLPNVDIRGRGGYVVAAPSVHATGAIYEWVNSPAERPMAQLPVWVGSPQAKQERAGGRKNSDRRRRQLCVGERNSELFRYACHLHSIGSGEAEIAAAIGSRNQHCCDPPLEDSEVRRIAWSASQYGGGFWLTDQELLAEQLSAHTVMAYLAIRSRADHQGHAIVGYDAIAEQAGIGVSRIKTDAIKELEAASLLRVTRHQQRPGRRLANEYTLLQQEHQRVLTTVKDATEKEER